MSPKSRRFCVTMSEIAAGQRDADPPQESQRDAAAATDGAVQVPPSPQAAAALAKAQAYARKSAAPATLRAYKADWAHYAACCAGSGFDPAPAAPATIGAYLVSLRPATHPPPFADGCRPSVKCTGLTTCPGIRRIAISTSPCRACCANTAAR